MRHTRLTSTQRILSVLVVFTILTTACTRTPPGGEVAFGSGASGLGPDGAPAAGGFETSEFGASESDSSGLGSAPGEVGTGSTGGSSPGTAPAGGSGSGSVAGQSGGSTPTATGGGPVQGVDGKSVKFVYSTQLAECGDDPTTSNQGTANEKGLFVLGEWVKWFNEAVLAQEGWKLEYEVVDDGGPFCPEKAQAAALKIVKELKPFAVLSNHVQPARGPVVADAVTRAGILHIGDSWSVARHIRERAPYAWPPFAVGERLFENLAGWMAERVKGTQVNDAATGVPQDRVYGILAVDSPEGRELGGVMQQLLRSHGMEPRGLYLISGDAGVAAQQSSNTALKMRQDGVNSLVLAVPYPSAINSTIVLSEAMNAQNYLPEIFVGNYGLSLFDSIHNKRVWARVRGTSNMPALVLRWAVYADSSGTFQVPEEFDEIAENEAGYHHLWQQKLGHNDAPQDSSVPAAYTTWTQLTLLVTGLLHLDGPLTPESFGEAVHSARRGGPNRCTVGRFMQRDYLYSVGFDWELGNSGLRAKSTSVYWVNEQTPFGSNGYYESYDNYRFYGADEWPAQHVRDTGEQGVDIPKQERIGIRPWTPCSQFPGYPSG